MAEAVWKLPILKRIPYEFMDDTVEHIFKGVVKNAGTADVSASGWHYLDKINPPGNKIIQVINEADEFGTIIAKIDIDGVAKKGFLSFFSNKYTPDEVLDMIMEAHMNKKLVPNTKGCYKGVANNGMTIEMYLYRNVDGGNIDDIITSYPVHTSALM
ncbi:EndoU domain-containing protein [Clostridium sp. YIM B02505]|uniref:EndoU domain-containing protein n=1 Tax=Clostridium yunnanense TaxID=2800325 RepID=A0ABS1EKQ0_9CLOT|nr:EndoU domain-containing protein [Clostridium yunnanense]